MLAVYPPPFSGGTLLYRTLAGLWRRGNFSSGTAIKLFKEELAAEQFVGGVSSTISESFPSRFYFVRRWAPIDGRMHERIVKIELKIFDRIKERSCHAPISLLLTMR